MDLFLALAEVDAKRLTQFVGVRSVECYGVKHGLLTVSYGATPPPDEWCEHVPRLCTRFE